MNFILCLRVTTWCLLEKDLALDHGVQLAVLHEKPTTTSGDGTVSNLQLCPYTHLARLAIDDSTHQVSPQETTLNGGGHCYNIGSGGIGNSTKSWSKDGPIVFSLVSLGTSAFLSYLPPFPLFSQMELNILHLYNYFSKCAKISVLIFLHRPLKQLNQVAFCIWFVNLTKGFNYYYVDLNELVSWVMLIPNWWSFRIVLCGHEW